LLDALEDGVVEAASLSAAQRQQVQQSPDTRLRRRARDLLAGQAAKRGRAEVLDRYKVALSLERSVQRGEKVFDQQCAKCHKLKDKGHEVGPDLVTTKTRADITLISDVMDPSAEITVGYDNYTVITEDGRIFTGVLAGETATSITLRKDEGVEKTILRKDIDEMAASRISMMPEDLEKVVTPQDVGDLIAFLRQSLSPAATSTGPVATLFEDDETFARELREGNGTAVVQTGDCWSGKAALMVTPPQRFSLKIPNWEYRIVENPGPGEYRYLRFAWKSRGGHGVMIELAGGGKWPPANKPLWRYYSGTNTTGWQAVQVASQAPENWVVVTRDLWKDFGDFVLTGIAPTAMGGEALFDRIELLRSVP
jgi:putative heme-binding domain-containing protein